MKKKILVLLAILALLVVLVFTACENKLPDSGDNQYTLETSVVGGGSITLDPAGGVYDEGTVVTATANSNNQNSIFEGWNGDAYDQGTANPITITMDSNKKIVAVYSEPNDTTDNRIVNLLWTARYGDGFRENFLFNDNGTFTDVIVNGDGSIENDSGVWSTTTDQTQITLDYNDNNNWDGTFDYSYNDGANILIIEFIEDDPVDFHVNVNGDYYEFDNEPNEASPSSLDISQDHTIHNGDDEDYLSFEGSSETWYDIETSSVYDGDNVDTHLFLYDSDGVTEITSNDDGGSSYYSKITFYSEENKTYYIKVKGYNSSTGDYTININVGEDPSN